MLNDKTDELINRLNDDMFICDHCKKYFSIKKEGLMVTYFNWFNYKCLIKQTNNNTEILNSVV